MPRKKLSLRSVPPPQRNIRKVPHKVKLRSVAVPPKPRRAITKTKFNDLSDTLISRILSVCSAKDILRGNSLYKIRQAYSLALTCTRHFTTFRNKLQVVDGMYPAYTGHPAPVLPDYLCPTQMTWIARLAQGRLQSMKLPCYTKGTTDVLVAVEYCCHYIREIGFTDRGMVFPNLASSLFTACNMINKVEIRGAQKSTIQAMWQCVCKFKEISLLDISTDCVQPICTLIEKKGKNLVRLQIAFDINGRYINGITEDDERRYKRIEELGDYLTENSLSKLEVLDISSSPYYIVDHDPWDVLDMDDRPGKAMLRNLKSEIARVREVRQQRGDSGKKIRQIEMMRVRCANIGSVESLAVNHLPLNEARQLEVVFPGGSVLFSKDEKQTYITSIQLGLHLNHGKDCILREKRVMKVVDLGNQAFLTMYCNDEYGVRSRVAKVLLQECGNITTIRGVFNLSRCEEGVRMAYFYVGKVMKFAMLVTTLDITYEIVLFGHGSDNEFRGMVKSWEKIKVLRLLNPGNYGIPAESLSEAECLAFVTGLQWLLELLSRACPKLEVVFLEDLGPCAGWCNAVSSRNFLNWAVRAVDVFEKVRLVDCCTLKALLKSWLRACI